MNHGNGWDTLAHSSSHQWHPRHPIILLYAGQCVLMILMLCYSGQTGRSRCGLTLLRRVKLTPRKQKLRLVAQSLAELPSHSLKPDNIKYEGLWYKVKVKWQCRLMWVLSLAITGVRPGNGLGLGWDQGSQCNCRVQIVWDYEPFQTVERPCFTCILLYRRSTIWNE